VLLPQVRLTVEPPTYAVVETQAAAQPLAPPLPVVGVAVVPVVAVAVARAALVGVGVELLLHVPLFVHQLSVAGLKGEFGGQSRLAAIGAMDVYFEPLYVTEAPLAYAVQLANAATPEQLTCADALDAKASSATATLLPKTERTRRSIHFSPVLYSHAGPISCAQPRAPSGWT
jgi:hypothetical protein